MKKFVCILLALALAVCLSAAALAVEEDNSADFTVTFTASKTMEKDYTEDQLKAAFSNMQPGDEITLTFTLKNQCDSSTTWYIKNTVIDSLERNVTGTNGAYSYVLTGIDAAGTSTTLFDSDTVNSEDSAQSGKGLNSATESLDDWNALFDLAAGKSGQVMLKVALDGESQANQYQDTDATVELSFAAEVNTTTTSNNTTTTNIVRTGDTANLPVMVIVAGVSGLLLLGLAVWSVKARKQEKEGTRK